MVESRDIAGPNGESALSAASWATTRHRARRRTILAAMQTVGTGGVTAAAMLVAYVMLEGRPADTGHIGSGALSLPRLLLAVVRHDSFNPYLALMLLSPAIHLLVFQWLGLYRVNLSNVRPFGPTWTILKGAVVGAIALIILSAAYGRPQGGGVGNPYPVLLFVYNGLLVFFGVLLFHSATLMAVVLLHGLGIWRTRVAIVHGGTRPVDLIESMIAATSGYRLAGEIYLDESVKPEPDERVRRLGFLDSLKLHINRYNLEEIILAVDPGALSTEQRLVVAQTCWHMGAGLKMVTPFHPFFRTSARPETVGGMTLLHVENVGLYATRPQILKRAMDILISFAALTVLSPVLLVTAIIVKLDSAGPIFFIQERVGLNGRTFRMFKFRSMRTDCDDSAHKEYLKELIRADAAHEVDADGKPIYKIANDPRITRFGNFIRKTSIDELPQLFNVLLGGMSLVGPRPPIQYEVDEYKDWHMKRLHIRPGITGLWQVSGRNRLSFDQMVELDIMYIEDWSLWRDISILFRTIPVVLKIDQSF